MSGSVAVLTEAGKRYGPIVALHGVSLALEEGERVALIGHNGAGKTTLMKLLLGLITPDTGSVRVRGGDPVHTRPSVGFLPESVAFTPSQTGAEAIAFFARLKRVPPRDGLAALDRVGLGPAADRRISGYSKGMRQRLGLAQALLGDPGFLVLDEPTTGLDPAVRRDVYAIVDELARRGVTVLLSSHALSELEERADRVIVLDRGRILASGTLDRLRELAALPTRVRLTLAGPAAPVIAGVNGIARDLRPLGADAIAFDCAATASVELVPRLAALGAAVRSVAIEPPTLDDLYAHFLSRERAP